MEVLEMSKRRKRQRVGDALNRQPRNFFLGDARQHHTPTDITSKFQDDKDLSTCSRYVSERL
jgi:hypothetical protein